MSKHYFINGQMIPCGVASKSTVDAPLKEPSSGLDALVKSRRFVAISIANCPQCEELAEILAVRGVPSSSVFVKWIKGSAEYPALKVALQAYAGDVFTFPQVFADGVYQGGHEKVRAKLDLGAYDEIFEAEFNVAPSTVQRWVNSQPMVVLSLPQCPQCDDLREQLEERKLPTDDIFIKLDKAWPQYQSLKAQLIQLIGKDQFTFPQTFVRSQYEGSFDEVNHKIVQGHFDGFFSDAFDSQPQIASAAQVASVEVAVFDEDF
jgi:glutaredoxin